MSIKLNSSMPMFAMRNLNKAQDKVAISMQRLSSGLRINSAADDAAGLAIATGMSSTIKGYNQSIRNANDGISLLQIAEGTLGEVTNVLQRMRELTVQAGNDTNSELNRSAILQEITMLSNSIENMLDNTQFNQQPLFSERQAGFHIGIEGGGLTLNVGGFNYHTLGLNSAQSFTGFNNGRVSNGASSDQAISINGLNLNAIAGTTAEKVTQLNNQLTIIGISAQGVNRVIAQTGDGITDGNLTINNIKVGQSSNINQLVNNINRDVGGISASLDSQGNLVLNNDTGQYIAIDNHGNEQGSGLHSDTFKGFISLKNRSSTQAISIQLNAHGEQKDLDALGFTQSDGNYSIHSQPVSGEKITSTDKITLNGTPLKIKSPISSAHDIASAFNDASVDSGINVIATTQVVLSYPDFSKQPSSASAIKINGQMVDFTASRSLDDVINDINHQFKNGDIVASADIDGKLSLTSKHGHDIIIEQNGSDFLQTDGETSTYHGTLHFLSEGSAIAINSNVPDQNNKESVLAKIGISDIGEFSDHFSGIDVSSSQGVTNSLNILDDAIIKVTEQRSSYGAQHNRLEQTINHLSGMVINTEASRSRIMDTDFAAESAALAKNQLLMQTSSAMLLRFTKMHSQQILSLINSLK